uniref:BACK domain-containing protein n=1 Tax=Tetranychus urticae TaxID=32264 RepID=T1JY83_TETUR
MDSLDPDDQLTILNRSTEYRISKKLIRKVPYFERMLSHECLESKENKVELDFDKQTLEIILNLVKSDYTVITIEMNYVITLYELADYLGLDWISKMCITCFSDNFSTKNLSSVIPQVTATSECVNSGDLNAFICRYFLKIANTTIWFGYPFETIAYICVLDLMIYSEYQVFDAIMRWVNFKADTRKGHLKGLLKLVRWCHLNEQDLSKIKENELFKSSGFEPIFCAPRKVSCNCTFNRAKQNFFIMIEKFEKSTDLRIKVLDNNLTQLVSQVIRHDPCVPSELFHDEHISDLLFDTRRNSLRIDWKRKKFMWFCPPQPYTQLLKTIDGNIGHGTHLIGDLEPGENIEDGSLLLEGAENFGLIYIQAGRLHYFSRQPYINYIMFPSLNQCKATILNDKIYLLTNKRKLYEFKIEVDNKVLRRTWSHRLWHNKFSFTNTLLTSNPAGDKIILVDKLTKKFISFDVNTKVSSKGCTTTYSSADDQKNSNSLYTLTSTFLPLNTIRTCLTKLNSKSNSRSLIY